MAGTRTFIFSEQKTILGWLQLKLISHFDSLSGNTDYNESASIISISSLNKSLPENAVVLKLDNVNISLSDFDNLTHSILYDSSGVATTMIEAKIYLDSSLEFWGTIDPQSITRSDDKLNFTINSILGGLLDFDPDSDLLPLLTIYSSSGVDYFQIKEAITKALGLVGFASTDIHYSVIMDFYDENNNFRDWSYLAAKKDDFFGSSKIHNLTNCLDLISNFVFSLLAIMVLDGDQIYIEDFETYNLGSIGDIAKKETIYFSKNIIDGLIISDKWNNEDDRGDYAHGKNVGEFQTFWEIDRSGSSNCVELQSGSYYKMYDTNYSTRLKLTEQIGTNLWNYFGSYQKELILETFSKTALLTRFTEDSEDFRIYDSEIDLISGKYKYKARKVS